MKKFLIMLLMLIVLPVFADTSPYYIKSVPATALGVYQTGKNLTLYSEPDFNAKIIKKFEFSYNPETMPDGMFAVLRNETQLGFLYVTDIDENDWVQVIYDKCTGARGWVQAEDKMQFLPWVNFYNLYGKKYGLIIFKDVPETLKVLQAKSEENSQIVSRLNYVSKIKLTAIRGNWALVSVLDLDKTPKTGFLRWRGADGTIYAFPNINVTYKN